jgi:hypothetical protein
MSRMMGTFIKAPDAIEGRFYCEYEWRYLMKPSTRRYMKKMLSHFRRRDGKLRILEGLAQIAEQEAMDRAEEAERDLEYRGFSAWDDDPWDEYDSDYRDDTFHDGVDYGAERTTDDAREYYFDTGYAAGFKAGRDYERNIGDPWGDPQDLEWDTILRRSVS